MVWYLAEPSCLAPATVDLGLEGRDLCDCLLDLVVLQEGHPLLAPYLDDTFGYRGYRLLTLLETGLGKVVFAKHTCILI